MTEETSNNQIVGSSLPEVDQLAIRLAERFTAYKSAQRQHRGAVGFRHEMHKAWAALADKLVESCN